MEGKRSARSNFGGRGWMLVIYSFISIFAITSIPQMFNATGDYYMAEYGWSMTTLQLFLTIGGLCSCILMFIIGSVSLKKSARKLALILLGIFAIVCLAFGFVNKLWLMGVLCVVAVLVGDTVSFILNSVLVANWFPKRSGMVMGWVTMGYPLAAGVGTVLMITFMMMGGIVMAYVPIIVLIVISMVILAFVLRDYPEQCGCYPDNDKNAIRENVEEISESVKSVWTTKRILSTKEFWLISLSIGFMMFSSGFMTQMTVALESLNFNMELLIPLMLGVAVVACIGSYVVGVLDMKLGTKKAVVIVDVVLLIMGLLTLTDNIVCVMIAFGCLAVVMGGGSNFLVSYVSSLWGPSFTRVFRFAQPIVSILGAVAMYVIAVIADNFGGYKASFIFASILAVISAVMILCVKEKNVEEKTARFEKEAVSE